MDGDEPGACSTSSNSSSSIPSTSIPSTSIPSTSNSYPLCDALDAEWAALQKPAQPKPPLERGWIAPQFSLGAWRDEACFKRAAAAAAAAAGAVADAAIPGGGGSCCSVAPAAHVDWAAATDACERLRGLNEVRAHALWSLGGWPHALACSSHAAHMQLACNMRPWQQTFACSSTEQTPPRSARPRHHTRAPLPLPYRQHSDPAPPHPPTRAPIDPQVFVIMFGADGTAESEGLYSLSTPGPEGLPCETVVAFESRGDAMRYCGERPHGVVIVLVILRWRLADAAPVAVVVPPAHRPLPP